MAAELAASTFPVTPPADAVAMIEAALSGESPLALVDVRTEGAFRAAHIVGAVRQRQADLSSCTNSTPIAFYCQTNAASRQGAYDHLRDHPGHTVYAFGGITALEGAGAPTEGGDAPNHNACVAEDYAARTAAWRRGRSPSVWASAAASRCCCSRSRCACSSDGDGSPRRARSRCRNERA